MRLIYDIPLDLSIRLLSDWLPIKSLVYLDTAVGRHNQEWRNIAQSCRLHQPDLLNVCFNTNQKFADWLELTNMTCFCFIISKYRDIIKRAKYVIQNGKSISHVALDTITGILSP